MPEEPKIKRGKILRNRYETGSYSGNDMEEYVNTITDPGYPFPLAQFEIEEVLDYIRLTGQNGDYIPENWRLFQRRYSRNRGTFADLIQEIRAEREAKNEDQSEGGEKETETSAIQRSHTSSPEQALNGKQKTDHRSVTQFSQTDNLLFLSSPDDREEIAADHAAEQIMQDLRPAEEMMKRPEEKAPDKTMGKRTEGGNLDAETTAGVKNLQGKGSPLPDRTRAAMEQSFGTDFGNVRVHTGPEAESLSQKMNARAFTYGNDIAFDRNEFNPDTQTGKELLAHELTHTLQQSDLSTGQGFSNKHETVYRESWESASKRAQNLRIKERIAKEQYDRLKTSFREILNNKNIGWNKDIGGPDAIKKAGNAGVFDTKKTDLLIAEWKWIVDHRASRNEKSYRNKTTMLFQSMEGPLTQVRRKREFRGAGTHTFIQLAAPSIIKATYDASDSFLPPDELMTYVFSEGLDRYLAERLKSIFPEENELSTFQPYGKIDMFASLGADDMWLDLNAPREPAKKFLPKGFDLSEFVRQSRINEQNRTVTSAFAPDFPKAVQLVAAIYRRRRTIFLQDAATYGYAKPTRDELVFWTHVYYNSGENAGQKSLREHKGRRNLRDWILVPGTYRNSKHVFENYKMLKELGF